MTNQHRSSYRQIMKATSLFGGVQVFSIIVSVIRSKVVAVLLGPAGMGIMGLLNTTLSSIGSFTNFGLAVTSVKDIAEADGSGNQQRVELVVTVFRRLVYLTGTLGTVTAIVLSPWLSQLAFGNKNYTIAFIWISVTLLFSQLNSGQLVILQGMRKLKMLAKANLFGNALSLLVTLPLYYIWGLDGIVPAIIGSSLVTLTISWLSSRTVQINALKLKKEQFLVQGKHMLKEGFIVNISLLLSVATAYAVRIFISRTGGVAQVGLYNAGFAIVSTYVGLIFSAMITDYYPRLSAVAHDNNLCRQTINQQAEIAILIMAPILLVFLIYIKWVVILLYSNKFIEITTMVSWAALGMFFKAASWSISFIFLAKGTSKLFFWNELATNVVGLMLNILGFYFGGLTGLGISFSLSWICYLLLVFSISKRKFYFSFNRSFVHIFLIQFGIAIAGFLAANLLSQLLSYIIGSMLIMVSGIISIKELEKRLGIIEILKMKLRE